IDEFGKCSRAAPMRIIFFRDGLSEGEYSIMGKDRIEDIEGELVQRQPFLGLSMSIRGDLPPVAHLYG
ncbi:uncharacterized protein EDB91DRAFT_1062209, partial [Suillus paluster]|uniref:uncharacterized protein n=1 Tax=Suillus paluster TaxID=48578 RepID=UPI001B862D1F